MKKSQSWHQNYEIKLKITAPKQNDLYQLVRSQKFLYDKQIQAQARTELNKYQLYKNIFQTSGLPNVGSTCFINSFIQFLFSSKKFRLKMLLFSPINGEKNKPWITKIHSIFVSMISSKNYSQKYDLLRSLARSFEQLTQGQYLIYTQQDAFIYLLKIINQLQIENQQYSSIFQLNYYKLCVNQKDHNSQTYRTKLSYDQQINQQKQYEYPKAEKNNKEEVVLQQYFKQYMLGSSVQYCCEKSCRFSKAQNYTIFIDQAPQVILINQMGQKHNNLYFFVIKQQKDQDSSHFKSSTQSKVVYLSQYIWKSQILYYGNGSSGHYVTRRRKIKDFILDQTSQLYVFNDNNIDTGRQTHYQYFYRPKIQLYQLNRLLKISPNKQQSSNSILNFIKVNHLKKIQTNYQVQVERLLFQRDLIFQQFQIKFQPPQMQHIPQQKVKKQIQLKFKKQIQLKVKKQIQLNDLKANIKKRKKSQSTIKSMCNCFFPNKKSVKYKKNNNK